MPFVARGTGETKSKRLVQIYKLKIKSEKKVLLIFFEKNKNMRFAAEKIKKKRLIRLVCSIASALKKAAEKTAIKAINAGI